MYTQFKELIDRFPTWTALSSYLKSAEGGKLKIIETFPFAIIRYEKGSSQFTIPHEVAFRSVVWNTETNRPVSVTPFKSEPGESIPSDSITDYTISTFQDGTLIGSFWDGTNWQIHTRSVLGANCRWYGPPLNQLFYQTIPPSVWDRLDKTACYSWILQHPENRIVCNVPAPRIILVGVNRIQEDGTVVPGTTEGLAEYVPATHSFPTWSALQSKLLEWNVRYRHNFQGFVMIHTLNGILLKIRTAAYNQIRLIRDNTPRLDFVWLTQWKARKLGSYLRVFPEEKYQAEAIVNRWKTLTSDVYSIYTSKYKAHTNPTVSPKYKKLLYTMHQHYYQILKPAGKTFTLHETIEWMNLRDVPQMLYLIHFELRHAIATIHAAAEAEPVEPATELPVAEA